MKSKLSKIAIPFILMVIIELGYYSITVPHNLYGDGLNPHMGLIFASGLLLGPYGAIGAALGDITCNIIKGSPLPIPLISGFISFAVSYLSYKLWYSKFYKEEINPPILINSFSLIKFLGILLVTALIFSILKPESIILLDSVSGTYIDYKYFFSYFNFGFLYSIIGIWIARKWNYFCLPKISKPHHQLFYKITFIALIILTFIFGIDELIFNECIFSISVEFTILTILLTIMLTKPLSRKISIPDKTTSEKIMNIFLITAVITLFAIVLWISLDTILLENEMLNNESELMIILSADIYFLIFFVPSTAVLRYIENKLIKPIQSLSKVKGFIHKNQKIETEGLLEIYSPYLNEKDEVGTLARNYSDLIISNNNYIENIQEIESEREKMKAELDIAKRIQQSNLPTEPIKNKSYNVFGYSKPAKEVGGDFYDYYEIDDENLAIVIGDASGKGVPAALLATTTQTLIKELLQHEKDPSTILSRVNNHIFQKNSETMFITLWLGIYNKNTNILTFSNAGHDAPLIKKDNKYEFLDENKGIVLGILEDFEFVSQKIDFIDEIILYTDGITDAFNKDNEIYGEKRLIDFFNKNTSHDNPINNLLKDIHKFTQNQEQFDDMTIVILRK
ncbi:MAG: serine/threonine-protein phosphatase [Methanobrevibacter sp.]|nr:serine/threonine-protein phosphatase [Methanobrevibacter sp.]